MPSKYLAVLVKPKNLRIIIFCLAIGTISIAALHLYNGIVVTTQDSSLLVPLPTSLLINHGGYGNIGNFMESFDMPEQSGSNINARRTNAEQSVVLNSLSSNNNENSNAKLSKLRLGEQELQNNLQLTGAKSSTSNSHQYQNLQEQNELDSVLGQQQHRGQQHNQSLQYRNNSLAKAQCVNRKQFQPDIDAVKIYPTLPFQANWIRYREYWNTFFEARYQTNKKSTELPHLKVFVIPHSHNDPGWVKTFEEYFYQQTKHILDNSIDKLMEHRSMTFQWSEIAFLSKWWDSAHPLRKENLLKLIDEGRFEIVTGGWVMTDEATSHLYSMIDQLVEGHQWIKNHLHIAPKSSWSVDPFGHGSTFPYLLKVSGIKSMVIQRIHYAWKKWLAEQQYGDFLWIQRWDNSPNAKSSIMCHNAPFDIYSIKHSCGPSPNICLNFDFRNISGEFSENHMYFQPVTKYNVKEKAELLLEQYGKTASLFPHNVAMISLGDDFRFEHAIEWDQQYFNYLQLFNYINSNFKTYKAEVKFATISEYFQAVGERVDLLPTFSGDFFVYSDIFSEGRPAYWSGYYGTRPYWKKFYRETENALRSAEILFSFANILSSQKSQRINSQVLIHEYSNLIKARRNLALFAHHDATTGTSKVETMNDYGYKLMDAMQKSLDIQMIAVNSILFSQTNNTHLSTDYEQSSFGDLPQKIPLKLNKNNERKIILFNNLGWKRSHVVKVVVTLPNVKVIGPNGQNIPSQLNPVMDITNAQYSRISSQLYELTFVPELSPFSLSVFTIKQTTLDNEHCASRSSVYCYNCSDPTNLFQVNRIQSGNIQLSSDRLQLLFDRNTGFLVAITKVKEQVAIRASMSFGAYDSASHRSGAYLLMIDPLEEIKVVPYPYKEPRIFIISGVLSSEVNVFHSPLYITTRIMHTGGLELEEAIHIQNQVDVGHQSGEVYMRFDTDLDSTTMVPTKFDPGRGFINQERLETFYTDQNGFTFEKRVKIAKIGLEGNYYPVTTLAFLQDETRELRFSIMVDRSHGFSSYESGRLETLIERRTIYDDGRGMGEGVTDNRQTISNYIITLESIKLEKLSSSTRTRSVNSYSSVPTLMVHHLSQQLNYPPSLFVMNYENFPRTTASASIFAMLNHELPCDVHVLNFRTLTEHFRYNADVNIPSKQILMIFQKLGYLCPNIKNTTDKSLLEPTDIISHNCTSSNNRSLFHQGTNFNRIQLQSITQCDLTGTAIMNEGISRTSNYSRAAGVNSNTHQMTLDSMVADSFEIKSYLLKFT